MAFGKQRWHGTVIATLVANPLDRKNAEREILIGLSGAKRNGYVLKWHPQPAATQRIRDISLLRGWRRIFLNGSPRASED
jgi:hypothetical protein